MRSPHPSKGTASSWRDVWWRHFEWKGPYMGDIAQLPVAHAHTLSREPLRGHVTFGKFQWPWQLALLYYMLYYYYSKKKWRRFMWRHFRWHHFRSRWPLSSSSIYGFRLPLWYLQTLLTVKLQENHMVWKYNVGDQYNLSIFYCPIKRQTDKIQVIQLRIFLHYILYST